MKARVGMSRSTDEYMPGSVLIAATRAMLSRERGLWVQMRVKGSTSPMAMAPVAYILSLLAPLRQAGRSLR